MSFDTASIGSPLPPPPSQQPYPRVISDSLGPSLGCGDSSSVAVGYLSAARLVAAPAIHFDDPALVAWISTELNRRSEPGRYFKVCAPGGFGDADWFALQKELFMTLMSSRDLNPSWLTCLHAESIVIVMYDEDSATPAAAAVLQAVRGSDSAKLATFAGQRGNGATSLAAQLGRYSDDDGGHVKLALLYQLLLSARRGAAPQLLSACNTVAARIGFTHAVLEPVSESLAMLYQSDVYGFCRASWEAKDLLLVKRVSGSPAAAVVAAAETAARAVAASDESLICAITAGGIASRVIGEVPPYRTTSGLTDLVNGFEAARQVLFFKAASGYPSLLAELKAGRGKDYFTLALPSLARFVAAQVATLKRALGPQFAPSNEHIVLRMRSAWTEVLRVQSHTVIKWSYHPSMPAPSIRIELELAAVARASAVAADCYLE